MKTDLAALIEKLGPNEYFKPKTVQVFMLQLLRGVAFIHGHRSMHRDIKPGNLLIEGGRLKIADLGLSRSISEPQRPYSPDMCTEVYRAPEVTLLGGQYGTEVDVWSCGCVFFELLTKNVLFMSDSDIDRLHKIFDLLGKPSNLDWPELSTAPKEAINLLQKLKPTTGLSWQEKYPILGSPEYASALSLLDVASLSASICSGSILFIASQLKWLSNILTSPILQV